MIPAAKHPCSRYRADGLELEHIIRSRSRLWLWQVSEPRPDHELGDFLISNLTEEELAYIRPSVTGHLDANREYQVLRAYINLQIPGQQGDWHRDSEQEGDRTILVYPSMTVTPEPEAGTEFLDGWIEPYEANTYIDFDSTLKHRSLATWQWQTYRYTVAIKLRPHT